MSTHSMVVDCENCKEEFYMDMEFHNRESLRQLAEVTECPKCHSIKWSMTDTCER